VRAADEAVRIESYLSAESILRAPGEAVHPGYGFLSENPEFAERVLQSGRIWVGPPPAAMRALGDKANAKKLAAAAGVPCKCSCVEGAFPYLEIIKAARRGRCDLIVMASHSRRGISRLLLGSQTSKVLALASVPVLVCR